MFTLTKQDGQLSNMMVISTLLVCSHEALVLFDLDSTYSYVSSVFVAKFGRDPSKLDLEIIIGTQMGDTLRVRNVYKLRTMPF